MDGKLRGRESADGKGDGPDGSGVTEGAIAVFEVDADGLTATGPVWNNRQVAVPKPTVTKTTAALLRKGMTAGRSAAIRVGIC